MRAIAIPCAAQSSGYDYFVRLEDELAGRSGTSPGSLVSQTAGIPGPLSNETL